MFGGCSSDWIRARDRDERANTTYPPNYKTEILAYLRTYLNDPRDVRDAFISEPALRSIAGVSRYAACVRYNAKRSDGRYGGARDNLVLFRDGRFDQLIDSRIDRGGGPDPARDYCKDVTYQRFPELERLSR
jgi:hypothetical protein